MSLSRASHKQLQEAMADFAVQMLSNDSDFQLWFMRNVTVPSTKYSDHYISNEAMSELFKILEKKLRGGK